MAEGWCRPAAAPPTNLEEREQREVGTSWQWADVLSLSRTTDRSNEPTDDSFAFRYGRACDLSFWTTDLASTDVDDLRSRRPSLSGRSIEADDDIRKRPSLFDDFRFLGDDCRAWLIGRRAKKKTWSGGGPLGTVGSGFGGVGCRGLRKSADKKRLFLAYYFFVVRRYGGGRPQRRLM